MNTFTLGACFQHKLHTGPYFMTFAPRLIPIATEIACVQTSPLPQEKSGDVSSPEFS